MPRHRQPGTPPVTARRGFSVAVFEARSTGARFMSPTKKQHLSLGGVVVATALPYYEDASAPAGPARGHDRGAGHRPRAGGNGRHGRGTDGAPGAVAA
ncbi:hypothetical protein [Streptomyces mexicanus]|uniref:hypothetical protein n=1 Tax=Streptomyces mexicanus TaxID=178566 RepID=UPI00135B2BDC|nr:hypothetical protein [Streptomyces mexicanus]